MPTPNSGPDIMLLLAADVMARRDQGIATYGTPLQPFNGRNPLRDLYEELLDAAAYVRQKMEEDEQTGHTCQCMSADASGGPRGA